MLKECIMNSQCYQNTQDFKNCVKEDIDYECISMRKQYARCKMGAIDRSRDFRSEQRNK
jgi:hypothetical protein